MSDSDYSEQAFLEFIKHSMVTGILRPQVAKSRKLAAEQLLTQLKSHERVDLRQLDVEELTTRFHKLQGSTVRTETLDLYSSRLQDALSDFISWRANPHDFVPKESGQKTARAVVARDDAGKAQAREELALNPPRSPLDIFTVPIREDHVIYLQNIPLDLTAAEAAKIARVVKALAEPDDDNPGEEQS